MRTLNCVIIACNCISIDSVEQSLLEKCFLRFCCVPLYLSAFERSFRFFILLKATQVKSTHPESSGF